MLITLSCASFFFFLALECHIYFFDLVAVLDDECSTPHRILIVTFILFSDRCSSFGVALETVIYGNSHYALVTQTEQGAGEDTWKCQNGVAWLFDLDLLWDVSGML